jgi:hypothetical protein
MTTTLVPRAPGCQKRPGHCADPATATATRVQILGLEDPADAANAVLGGLLLAVLGRAMVGADPTDPRFRRHLADQILRGVVTG